MVFVLNFVRCSAVKKVLEEKGILSELRAKIRAEIYESLQIGKQLGITDVSDQNDATINDESTHGTSNSNPKSNKKWTKDEILIHELIKEYMSFHGLQHSLSVFGSETNCFDHPSSPTWRCLARPIHRYSALPEHDLAVYRQFPEQLTRAH